MIAVDAFRDQPVLAGASVRLEPLTEAVYEDYRAALADPEVSRLPGTHATYEPADVLSWLRTRRDQHERADWAVLRVSDEAFLEEAVVNDLDADNESAGATR